MNDPTFRQLVDLMTSFILKADFTPSEMREAAVLASINYENLNHRRVFVYDAKLEEALSVMHNFATKEAK